MFLKRKQSRKMKGKGCAKGRPHQEHITKEGSSSPIISLYALLGSFLVNAIDYNFNYKLRSTFGQEDDFTANKWTWFDMQVSTILLWTRVVSQTLVDYTKIGRIIGGLLNDVQVPSALVTDCNKNMKIHFSINQLYYIQDIMIIYGFVI